MNKIQIFLTMFGIVGVEGEIVDNSGKPLPSAIVTQDGEEVALTVSQSGIFHRILDKGQYQFTATAPGKKPSRTLNKWLPNPTLRDASVRHMLVWGR